MRNPVHLTLVGILTLSWSVADAEDSPFADATLAEIVGALEGDDATRATNAAEELNRRIDRGFGDSWSDSGVLQRRREFFRTAAPLLPRLCRVCDSGRVDLDHHVAQLIHIGDDAALRDPIVARTWTRLVAKHRQQLRETIDDGPGISLSILSLVDREPIVMQLIDAMQANESRRRLVDKGWTGLQQTLEGRDDASPLEPSLGQTVYAVPEMLWMTIWGSCRMNVERPHLLEIASGDEHSLFRFVAIRCLSHYDDGVVPVLEKIADDPKEEALLRVAAAESASAITPTARIQLRLMHLLRDAEPKVKQAILARVRQRSEDVVKVRRSLTESAFRSDYARGMTTFLKWGKHEHQLWALSELTKVANAAEPARDELDSIVRTGPAENRRLAESILQQLDDR